MKSNFYLLILVLAMTTNIFTNCGKQTELAQKTIAVIDDHYKISFADLHKYVYDEYFHRRYRDKSEAYQRALDEMVLDQLKCIDFFKRGLNNDSQLMQQLQRYINEELIVKYFESEYLGKYTSEEFARKTYDQMGKEVYYQQIILNKPENASDAQSDALKNQAVEIKTKAEQGVDFNELIKQYATNNAPDVSVLTIDWEKSMVSPHNRVIFSLNKGDVRILDEYNAYYVVKITDVRPIKLKPFNKVKDELISQLQEGYYYTSLDEYDRDKKALVNEDSIVWNEKALDQLVKWSRIPNFYKAIYRDTLQNAISSGRNLTILTYPKGQIDLKEYLRLLNEILILGDSREITKEKLEEFIIEALRSDQIVRKARDLGLEKEVFNPYTNNPALKYKIVELYDKAVIESQIPEPTEAALQEFYQANRDSLYYQLEKINLYAVIYSDKSEADQMWAKIQAGTTFNEASNRWFVKTFIKDRDGQIKSYLSQEPPHLGEAAFKLKEGEVDGVIEYTDPDKGRQYAIIKCEKRTPEKQLTYDEVRKSIADDFIKYHRKQISQEVTKYLYDNYEVNINEKLLAKAIKSLSDEQKKSSKPSSKKEK
ncbi:MAG TPA: peptidyl-prolyl cis-trans isomerase [Candidatus Marinimicrobia bacterium]|nr:peptidyl-prolyl cis-trans isomerase [Candidatus Neomarinimicrobiota bacterium]